METPEKNDTELAQTLETPQQDGQIKQPVEQSVPLETKEDSPQAVRFKTLREAREKAERERDELKRQLEAARAPKPEPIQQPVQDYVLGEEEMVEGRHLSKYDRDIKALREELQRTRQEASIASVENKLKAQYNDFDSIVNKENLEVLQRIHPEIAATIQNSPDLYNKAVTAYTLLKRLGISGSVAQKEQAAVAHNNATKPRPLASAAPEANTDSPLENANVFATALTDERKREVFARMQRTIKGG